MREELEKKIERSIKLLRSIPTDKGQITLAYSGGKDSDVILELAKMAGIPFKAVYHSTTIDPPGTIRHVEENGVEISRPKDPFFKIMQKNGYPSRFARYCCRLLKERYDSDIVIQGIRASESKARADRYKEPEQCRVYDKKHKSRVYMPILQWTDEDVKEFVTERGIKCHPLYYRGGQFDVTQRLGCIGCPLQYSGKRIKSSSSIRSMYAFISRMRRNGTMRIRATGRHTSTTTPSTLSWLRSSTRNSTISRRRRTRHTERPTGASISRNISE